LVQRLERRAGQIGPAAVDLHFEAVGVEAVDLLWTGAQETEARHVLAAADALQQKAVGRDLLQPPVDAERRQAVGEELPDVRNRTAWPSRIEIGHVANPLRRVACLPRVLRTVKTVSPRKLCRDFLQLDAARLEEDQQMIKEIRGLAG